MNGQKELLELVETMGVQAEKDGFPPAAARLFALLLLSDPPYLTFEQLQQTLTLSKSSVSNGLSLLQSRGLIDYFTVSGDRKRYFRVHKAAWYEYMKTIVRTQRPFLVEVIDKALTIRSDQYPEANQVLQQAKEFTDHMFGAMETALVEWEKKQKQ
ncbi:GbsR/MarR family transcriptional regulator [Spirosoma pomorum]